MSWFSDLRNKVQQTSKDLGITDKLNQASEAWNEFWDKPMTIQYAHNPYEVVTNKGPQEVTQRRGDVVKQVALASSVPALAAGVVTAGVPATISGFTIGTATGVAGSYGGKKAALFIGLDENALKLAGNIAGTLTGLYGGTGPARTIANRNIIAYNNVYPFGYSLRSINLKGLTKDVLTGFINPFKKYRPTRYIEKHSREGGSILFPTNDSLLSRDTAFRKALKIDLLPEQKGFYYDRPDGTVGINYNHPLATPDLKSANKMVAFENIFNRKNIREQFTTNDRYTFGGNGGNIGIKDFKYNPDTGEATFTTYDTWDLLPLQLFTRLPKFIRNLEFVKLAGGKPFTWVDNLTVLSGLNYKSGGRIHIKPENRGKFTEYCGGKVTDECIQRAKRSGNKKLIKRAVFALNSRKWKH